MQEKRRYGIIRLRADVFQQIQLALARIEGLCAHVYVLVWH